MIVDDEATVRMLVNETLTENSYRVLEAHDAASAMKILKLRSINRFAGHRCRPAGAYERASTRRCRSRKARRT